MSIHVPVTVDPFLPLRCSLRKKCPAILLGSSDLSFVVTLVSHSSGVRFSLIIAPGGAFHFLMMDHEGYDVAQWLAELGITAFVLRYRVQQTPENDADMPAFLEKLGIDLPNVSQTSTNQKKP